ncbi:MAG: hypothetical protein JNM84_09620 [Planctomycetes bacterium]|nr:hypothetical protein [Planctomycetota bacterium]
MSCWRLEFLPTPPISPLTFWVHRPIDRRRGQRWEDATSYEPPRERPIPGRGYPLFHVSCGDLSLRFASLAEIEACASILGRKLLPRALDLVRSSGVQKGPHAHWLSRLPARWKRWSRRERLAARLRVALVDFRARLEQARS